MIQRVANMTKAGKDQGSRKNKDTGSKSEGKCEIFAFDEARVQRVKDGMLASALVADAAETFKVLANPTRVRIIRSLAEEELCVCDLAQVLDLSVSATSHQLQLLRQARVVRYRMEGKLAYYSLRDRFVLELLKDCVMHVTSGGERQ